jgi:hypothetical protein
VQGDRESGAKESPKHTTVTTGEWTGTDTQTTEPERPGRGRRDEMKTDNSDKEKNYWNIWYNLM